MTDLKRNKYPSSSLVLIQLIHIFKLMRKTQFVLIYVLLRYSSLYAKFDGNRKDSIPLI